MPTMTLSPYLATPCYGGLCDINYTYGLLDFMRTCLQRSIPAKVNLQAGESLIPRARNHLLACYRQTKCSHLAYVDADIGWRGQDLIDMMESGLPVVCGIYPKKGYDWERMMTEIRAGRVATADEARQRAVNLCMHLRDEDIKSGHVPRLRTDDGKVFIEAARGATGFMVITRETVEKMIEAYPERRCFDGNEEHYNLFAAGPNPADDPITALRAAVRAGNDPGAVGKLAVELLGDPTAPTKTAYLGEDYAFCQLWTMIGGKVYLYPGAKLSHTGSATYEGDINQIFKG